MTREEAIEKLLEEHCGYGDGDCDRCKFKCEIYMAIEALRQQIPKPVRKIEQRYGTPYFCPECEADQCKVEFFTTDGSEPKEKVSYCWQCGQAIDWKEDENDR